MTKVRKRVAINTKSINNNNKIVLHCFLLVVQFLACRCSITCTAEHVYNINSPINILSI